MACSAPIEHIQREDIPGIPEPPKRKEQFSKEHASRFTDAIAELNKLREKILASSLSGKKQADLLMHIEHAKMEINSNTDFVAEQFEEHMETVIEHAKIEANAYIVGAVQRAGLQALGVQPLQLAEKPQPCEPCEIHTTETDYDGSKYCSVCGTELDESRPSDFSRWKIRSEPHKVSEPADK